MFSIIEVTVKQASITQCMNIHIYNALLIGEIVRITNTVITLNFLPMIGISMYMPLRVSALSRTDTYTRS